MWLAVILSTSQTRVSKDDQELRDNGFPTETEFF
jgi:biotin operon repressor